MGSKVVEKGEGGEDRGNIKHGEGASVIRGDDGDLPSVTFRKRKS